MDRDPLTEVIIAAAIAVHRALGAGLLESAYRPCMVYELKNRGLGVVVEKPLPIVYGDIRIPRAYLMDLVVEDRVVVELKSIERFDRVHLSQLITYLKLSSYPIGLLINFNVPVLRDGIRRVHNNYLS